MHEPATTRPARRPRLRCLDFSRGIALLLMILVHGVSLFLSPSAPASAYAIVTVIFTGAKIAAPLFLTVFGMTMAVIYLDGIRDPQRFSVVVRRLWVRAGWVFVARQVLVVVCDAAEGRPPAYILRRLLFLESGDWTDVLNAYVLFLLVAPWVLRMWSRLSLFVRLALIVGVFALGSWLAGIPVPDELRALKNVFVGYRAGDFGAQRPDSFPALPLAAFFLGGLLWGERLAKEIASASWRTLYTTGVIAAAAFGSAAFLLAGRSPADFATAIAGDLMKHPPTPAYVCYGFAGVLATTLLVTALVEHRSSANGITRCVEALGRNSLFTFNLQYVLLFTVFGMGLGELRRHGLTASLALTFIVAVACLVAAPLWEDFKRRARHVE